MPKTYLCETSAEAPNNLPCPSFLLPLSSSRHTNLSALLSQANSCDSSPNTTSNKFKMSVARECVGERDEIEVLVRLEKERGA